MPAWLHDSFQIFIALALVLLNGFFVAAEFALVKVRAARVEPLVSQGRPFAKTARWLVQRLERSLSACQLGITMASLALGWVGAPAFARLLAPLFELIGIRSAPLLHALAFGAAFTAITALHLILGEQAPKIFAIRRAELLLLSCAVPLKVFYVLTFPLMAALTWSTSVLLGRLGLEGASEHDTPHSEQELRTLLREAHLRGQLTGSEHRLIHAVFEFDDMICRNIMLPRSDVVFFDINAPVQECIELARRTKHTRYPVCDGSLDEVLGVIHVKDLVGHAIGDSFTWRSIMRPPRKVPENLPISKLLLHFQATHQLLAFVVDEYGTIIGIVTLENVLEQIIGDVEDEFDVDNPNIVPGGQGQYIILGRTPIDEVREKLDIDARDANADTLSGLLTQRAGRILTAGDQIDLGNYTAEVLEVRDDRAVRVRVRKHDTQLASQ